MNEKLVHEVGDLKVNQVKYIVLCVIWVTFLSMKKYRKHKYRIYSNSSRGYY